MKTLHMYKNTIVILFAKKLIPNLHFPSKYGIHFLDAFSHLYKRVCLSVRPSVRRSSKS